MIANISPVSGRSLVDFCKDATRDSCYTPDNLALMSSWQYVPVFVYGCEKQGFSEDDILQGSPRIGNAFLSHDAYVMYRSVDNEPVVFERRGLQECARVQGELYWVNTPDLRKIDHHFQNKVFFERTWRTIDFYPPEDRDKKQKRWSRTVSIVYLGRECPYWVEKRQEGKLKLAEVLTGKNDVCYYSYMKKDDWESTKCL